MFPALRAWLGGPHARLVDSVLTLVVGVATVASAVSSGASQGRTAWGIVFGVAVALPLFVRRRWPLAVLACVVTATVLAPVSFAFEMPLIVALYTIGVQRSWETTIAAAGAVVLVALVYSVAGGPGIHTSDVIGIALLCAIASGAGRYIGSRRASIAGLEERAARLTRERELLAERAVAEERVRIAQELHDVVAHNVSLIVVQAQALGATSGDPDVAAATDGIADLGRSTMAEMHRTLRLLRADGESAELAPQPGLADLPSLVSRSRDAGLRVDLAIEGAPRRLAQSVDLSAFRIVQEALTNVFRHAGRADTSVSVVYGPEALELTIVDRGDHDPARDADPTPGGHGLIGMRERTALFGGTLTAGPRPGAGFEVRASLPYDEEPA